MESKLRNTHDYRPGGRYCDNLGHLQDDESNLVYMRARYYDPTSGRFISQDPSLQGMNWFAYARNNPIEFVDESGNDWNKVTQDLLQAFLFIAGEILLDMWQDAENQINKLTKYVSQLQSLLEAGITMGGTPSDLAKFERDLKDQQAFLNRAKYIKGGQALLKLVGYMMILRAFLMDIDYSTDGGKSGLDIILGM